MDKLTKLLRAGVALSLGAIVLLSCKGKDGDPGPQGDQGAAGITGVPGQPGDLPNSRIKEGFVRGTITGFRQYRVTPLNETFSYEFYERNALNSSSTVYETMQPGVYDFSILRGDSLGASFFQIRFIAPLDFSADTVQTVDIRYDKELSNNQVLGVDGYYRHYRGRPQVVVLTNLAYNTGTGLLTGNFTYNASNENVSTETFDYYSSTVSGHSFTVSGSFSIRALLVSSFRKKTIPHR